MAFGLKQVRKFVQKEQPTPRTRHERRRQPGTVLATERGLYDSVKSRVKSGGKVNHFLVATLRAEGAFSRHQAPQPMAQGLGGEKMLV